jgi:hypothetical protein
MFAIATVGIPTEPGSATQHPSRHPHAALTPPSRHPQVTLTLASRAAQRAPSRAFVSLGAVAAVHPLRTAQIAEINAANTTWKAAAHPRFAASPPGGSKGLLGLKGNWQVDIADAIKRGEMERYVPSGNVEVPTDWDASTAFPKCAKTIGDIRDRKEERRPNRFLPCLFY